jgi:hypothetical protein
MRRTWRKIYKGREYVVWKEDGKQRRQLAHRWIWEQEHGPIPGGYHIHHKDHDQLNNDLANLQLIEAGEHWKHHGELRTAEVERDGQRRCSTCEEWKDLEEFAARANAPRQSQCRTCSREYLRKWRAKNREHHNAYHREYRRRRAA